MRRLSLALFLLFASIGNASAWGDTGHRIVCEIAFRLAAPETRAEIRRLIQTDSEFDFFRDSCIWPDHPRKRGNEHFINLPRTSAGIGSDGACPAAAACTLTAIAKDMAVLSLSSSSDPDKLASLKFLGHWVGDVHQPLHVSFEDDRGGNNIRVSGECTTNMHSAWDTCLLQKAVGSDVTAAATDLLNSVTTANKEEWVTTNPPDWANESFAIAEAAGTKYCILHGSSCDLPSGTVRLDVAYVEAHKPILREQLQKAGVRLAHLLDTALHR
jgi:hypothetical protein